MTGVIVEGGVPVVPPLIQTEVTLFSVTKNAGRGVAIDGNTSVPSHIVLMR